MEWAVREFQLGHGAVESSRTTGSQGRQMTLQPGRPMAELPCAAQSFTESSGSWESGGTSSDQANGGTLSF